MGRLIKKKSKDIKVKKKQSEVTKDEQEVKVLKEEESKEKKEFLKEEKRAEYIKNSQKEASKNKKSAPQKENIISRSIRFLQEVQSELKKVIWPERKQTGKSSLVVIVLVLIIAALLGLMDGLLSFFLNLIFSL